MSIAKLTQSTVLSLAVGTFVVFTLGDFSAKACFAQVPGGGGGGAVGRGPVVGGPVVGGGGAGGGGTCGRGGGAGGGAGGGGGRDINLERLDLGGVNFEFENIRQARFAGATRADVVHPFTRIGNAEAQVRADNVAANAAAPQVARTQTNVGQAGNVAGTNQFNSPFGQFGQFGGRGGFGGFGGFGGNAFGFQQQTPIRSNLTFNSASTSHLTAPTNRSVSAQSPAGMTVSQPLVSRVRSIPGLERRNIEVVMDGRTAVVSGVVSSEDESKRIGRILKLEPGVSSVENRLQVINQ